MRSRYTIINNTYPHFVTSTIVEWLPIFTKNIYCDIIIQALNFCRKQKGLKIHAYVLLDNHLHLILSGNDIGKIMKEFKSFTARKIIDMVKENNVEWLLNQFSFFKKKHKKESDYQIWQEGFHPQMIEGEELFNQKLQYIHNNPVKRGLVEEPEHWVYCSASNYSTGKGVLEIDFV